MAQFQFSADICEHAVINAEKFKSLFIKYSLRDVIFNSSIYLGDEEISQLAVNINVIFENNLARNTHYSKASHA